MKTPVMDTNALLEEIAAVLPPVPKPPADTVVFHESGCLQCQFLREDLEQYREPILPDEALRYLHNEWSCLSATGTRWVLPSYLRRCLTHEASYDGIETEFLIYTLSPAAEYQEETRQRLSALDSQQLDCLLHFLDWAANHPHWSTYCPDEIAQAMVFVRSLLLP